MGRDPLGSTKKRVTYTAKRTIVIQTERYAFKTRNSLLTRPFCSNRLLFVDDGDDGDDGAMIMMVDVELWRYFSFVLLMSQLTAFQHAHGRMHTISYHGQIVQTSLSNKR